MPSPLQALVERTRREDLYEDRMLRTLNRIRGALARCSHPYVAYSGGKDSTLVLALTLMAGGHEHPGGLVVAYTDDEILLPQHVDHVARTAAAVDVMPGVQFVHYSGGSVHAGWHRPWREEPFWRPQPPEMQWVPKSGMLSREARALGYDLCLLGRRAGESARRAEQLLRTGGVSVQHGVTVVDPIWDWTHDHVWDCLHRLRKAADVEWCPVYDILQQEVGWHRDKCRVGPVPLMGKNELEIAWPDMYAALVRRYGNRWS